MWVSALKAPVQSVRVVMLPAKKRESYIRVVAPSADLGESPN